MAFVNDNQPIARKVPQFFDDAPERKHPPDDLVRLQVAVPHGHKFRRANDQRIVAAIFLHETGNGSRHQCFSEAHHIAKQHTAMTMELLRRKGHGSFLKIEQHIAKHGWHLELAFALAGVLREVIGNLEVHQVGADEFSARPALLDQIGKFVGEINRPVIVPSFIKPALKFAHGILLDHIYVQFALLGKTRQGKIAAPDKANQRCDWVFALDQIQLRVQRIAQKCFDNDFPFPQLPGQPLQRAFRLIRGHAELKLIFEALGDAALEERCRRTVNTCLAAMDTLQTLHLLFRRAMHPHQDATGVTFIRSAQMLDSIGNLIPAAQVQVANAERAREHFYKDIPKSFH